MPTRFVRSALVATLLLVPCGSLPSARATDGTPAWTFSLVSTVDANTYVSSPVMAFDHYGTPSVAWSAVSLIGGTNVTKHSQLTGLGLWNHRDIASGAGVGLRSAIAFDRAERPSLAWVNSSTAAQGQFNYGGVQSVAASGANTANPIITLGYDLAGNLRGMFQGSTPGNFLSIGYSSGNFNSSNLLTFSGVTSVLDASMTTDHRGLRHIAARSVLSSGQQALSLASEPPGGGAWVSTHFVTASSVDGADIAVDPTDGRLVTAYTTFDSGTNTSKLIYTKFNGAITQTTEIATSTSTRYFDLSLAFDLSDGRPAIAYERLTGGAQQLVYSWLNASQVWQTSTVDTTILHAAPGGAPRRPSLAFDDYGTSWPAISYVDSDGSLRVAFDPPVPEPATAVLLLTGGAMLRRRVVRADRRGRR